MPINFFDSISLDKQEIQSVAIENLSADPGSPASGQIYFNTGTDAIRYYDGAAWIELDGSGGVTSVLAAAAGTSTGTVIVVDPVAGTGTVTLQPMAYAGGTNVGFVPTGSGASASVFLDGSGQWSTPAGGGSMSNWILTGDSGTGQTIVDADTVLIAGGTALTTIATATDTLTVNHDTFGAGAATHTYPTEVITNSTGHITSITGGSAPTDTTYDLTQAGTTTATIVLTDSSSATDVVSFLGTANQITLTGNGSTTITATLPNAVIAPGTLASTTTLAAGTSFSVASTSTFTGIATFTALPTIPETPVASTDAASKGYVDSVLVGALVFQGGYNATADTTSGGGSLDGGSGTSIAVTKGWTYVVTVAGSFFTEAVEVGDVLIAEVDMAAGASALADWTTVQNNIGIATAAATDALTVKGISGYSSAYFDVTTDGWVETNTGHVASIGTGVATALTVNHALNSRDVIVQLYDMTTFDTVFAQVVRTDVNNVTVTFSTAPASSGIRCVITKVSNVT